jgi:Trypsin
VPKGASIDGSTCKVIGYGTTSPNSNRLSTLQDANTPLLDSDKCNASYSQPPVSKPLVVNEICAGFIGENAKYVGPCFNDNAAPLFCRLTGQKYGEYLVGMHRK